MGRIYKLNALKNRLKTNWNEFFWIYFTIEIKIKIQLTKNSNALLAKR